MEIIGKIILKLPLQTGVSKAGNNWSKQEYVLETQENFPKKVHFDFFGDRATQYDLQEGQMVKLSFDIESREYNGRWYTSIRGWKAEPADAQAPVYAGVTAGAPAGAPAVGGVPVQPAAAPAAPAAPAPDFMNESPNADDLPF